MELNEIHKSIRENLLYFDNFDEGNNREKSSLDNFIGIEDTNSDNIENSLICTKCNGSPEIIFEGEYYNIECFCHHIKNSNYEYFYNNYLKKTDKDLNQKIKEESFCKCQEHKMKYIGYCGDCSIDICEKCFAQKDNSHLNHTTLSYPNLLDLNIEAICKNILRDKFVKGKNENKKLIKVINLILLSYKNYPCFTNYKNLDHLLTFFRKIKDKSQELNASKEMEIYYKINRLKELKNIIKNDCDKINKIESISIETQNFYDLNLLKFNESINSYNKLSILDLRQNNISDISPLTSINFPELINLNLSINRLSNDNIDNILNLNKNCPKLTILDLSNNAFTEYRLLEICQKVSNLKVLNIGNNLLYSDYKKIKNEYAKFDFSNLNEFGLSFGVFSKQSIDLIKIFNLDNIIKLDLSSNNLYSLTFIKKVNCYKLEEILLSNNYLKEFYILKKLKKLKSIDLKGNHIFNIYNLNKFLNELPNIEKLILSDNNIYINKTKNDDIIENANNQRNSHNYKIQIII